MKITRQQLRKIIKESLLLEAEMLPIITNSYEDVDDINVLANYAHRDDMAGALKDPTLLYYIDKNEAGILVDDSYGWLEYVGKEDDFPAPAGWNLKKVYDFLKRFENEAFKVFDKKEEGEHGSLPNKDEREIIGKALTMKYAMPDDIKGMTFQVRKKGGKPSNINIETAYDYSNIRADDAERKGLTLDDVIKVLRDNGATERKRQKSRKSTRSMYD